MSAIPASIAEIPVMPVIEFLYMLDQREPHGIWGTWFSGFDNSVQNAMPEGTTELRARPSRWSFHHRLAKYLLSRPKMTGILVETRCALGAGTPSNPAA